MGDACSSLASTIASEPGLRACTTHEHQTSASAFGCSTTFSHLLPGAVAGAPPARRTTAMFERLAAPPHAAWSTC